MSKKIVTLLIAFCLLLSFTACGTTEINNTINNNIPTNEAQAETTQNTTEKENTYEEIQTGTQTPAEQTSYYQNPQNTNQQTSSSPKPTTHKHTYSNATCTSPKKCSCGETAGSALGHQFSSATCTSPKICNRCGITSGSALGHSYSGATCTSPKKCSRCSKTQGSALGHNYVNNKCSRCGKVDPNSLPVGLETVHIIDSKDYQYNSGSFTDSFGNKYTGVHILDDTHYSSRTPYATFYLNNKYQTFTGSIVISNSAYSQYSHFVNIYADGVLIYSKSGIHKMTGKIDFKLDVAGVNQLTIKVGGENNEYDYINRVVGIVNAQLSK